MRKTGAIFTVGYGASPAGPPAKRELGALTGPDVLAQLVRDLDVVLIDARADPGPARPPKDKRPVYVRKGFRRYELAAQFGAAYRWRGDRLGGVRDAVRAGPTPDGLLELVADFNRGERLLLLCAEAAPGDCHRHHLIACPLGHLPIEWDWKHAQAARATLRAWPAIKVHHIFDARAIESFEPAERVQQVITARALSRFHDGKTPGYRFNTVAHHKEGIS